MQGIVWSMRLQVNLKGGGGVETMDIPARTGGTTSQMKSLEGERFGGRSHPRV